MGRRTKVASFEAAKKKQADRFRYTAENARDGIMATFDAMQHRAGREQRLRVAEVERVNRKKW